MKTIASFIPAGLLYMACFTAQATDCGALPPQDHSEAAVLKLDEEWSRAYSTGDQAFLECLYATGFASANANGALRSRDEDIAGARKNIGKSWSPDGHKYNKAVQMFPHAAVVTMVRKDGEHSTRITDIYEYDGRRWQVMFTQDTKF